MAGIDNLNYAEPKNVVSKLYIAGNEAKFEKLGGAQHTSDAEKARDILTKLAHSIKNKDMGINIEKKGKDKNTLPSHISSIDITKILSKLPLNGSLKLPTDETIKSLFVFGIDDSLPEYKLTEYFETFGSIKSFNCQHNAKAGYITFNERKGAENAAQEILKLNSNDETKPALFIIDNIPLRCCWGKERPLGNSYAEKVKLGSVVTKVMKKLAKESSPKEIKSPTKKRTLETQDHTVVKKPQLDDKKTYKSLSKNYEA
jgi:pre-mRNA-splicing factor RBM22/SLT11